MWWTESTYMLKGYDVFTVGTYAICILRTKYIISFNLLSSLCCFAHIINKSVNMYNLIRIDGVMICWAYVNAVWHFSVTCHWIINRHIVLKICRMRNLIWPAWKCALHAHLRWHTFHFHYTRTVILRLIMDVCRSWFDKNFVEI